MTYAQLTTDNLGIKESWKTDKLPRVQLDDLR